MSRLMQFRTCSKDASVSACKQFCLNIIVSIFLVSCNRTPQPVNPQFECENILSVESVVNPSSPQVMVFGEYHGTKEIPYLMENLICHSLNSGISTLFVIEFSPSNFEPVEKFLYSKSPTARDDLLRHSYWMSGNQDGKRSIAMFQMIEKMKFYTQNSSRFKMSGYADQHIEGLDLRDIPQQDQENNRAIIMSDNLVKLAKENPKSKIFVLTGNYHSGRYGEEKNMATRLPRELYWSFNVNSPAGTTWTWAGGITKTGARINRTFIENGEPIKDFAIVIFDDGETRFHDGLYYIPSLTVSRPTYE